MPLSILPQPKDLTETGENFTLTAETTIHADATALPIAWQLHDLIATSTGIRLPVEKAPSGRGEATPSNIIALRTVGEGNEESYTLAVDANGVEITAPSGAGFQNAFATLIQLMPVSVLRQAGSAESVSVAGVQIADEPSYGWRGFMLDPARHFLPKEFVMRMLDIAALLKMNKMHFHLTDDQGWRIEVPGWPKLVEQGSWRPETVIGHAGKSDRDFDGTPHGSYYTTEDLQEIVAYAAARHIEVVPEIDLPGHMGAALRAYPELGIPGTIVEPTIWGVSDMVLRPSPEALQFVQDVVAHTLTIFPGEYIHLGGDEVPKTGWENDEYSRGRVEELGLNSVEELQNWFLKSCVAQVREAGRKAICWDEALEADGMPKDTVIAAWRVWGGGENRPDVQALKAGHQIVNCAHEWTYLDAYASEDAEEPLSIGGLLPVEKVAEFSPVPPGVSEEEASRVLGLQGQLWSEYMKDGRAVEYRAFPRLSVLADIGWASPEVRAAHPVADRLPAHLELLDVLGVNYRPLAGPHPWQQGGTGRLNRNT